MAEQTHTCRPDEIPDDTVTKTVEGQISALDPQRAESYVGLEKLRSARAGGYAREHKRLALKYGNDSPRVAALVEKTRINQGLQRDLNFEQARSKSETPTVDEKGYVFHGFVRDLKGQVQQKLTVALYDEKGNWISELGYGCTDERGYFILRYQQQPNDPAGNGTKPAGTFFETAAGGRLAASQTQPLAKIYVLDAEQKTLHVEQEPLRPKLGQVDFRIIVLGAHPKPCTPPPPSPAPPPEPTPTPPPTPTPGPTPTPTPGPAPTPTPTPPPTPGPTPTPPPTPPPDPTPGPTPRTSLDKLDIDEVTRKRLNQGGIIDVEGIIEADPAKLVEIVGNRELVAKLIEQAKAVLSPAPVNRTPLTQFNVDAATRRRLVQGGIRDVEHILEIDQAKLAEIVGNVALATKLREQAQAVIKAKERTNPNVPTRPRKPSRGRKR